MDDRGVLVALPHLVGIPNHTLLLGVWLLSAAIAASIADEKDRSAFGFFALGLLIGPLAIVAAVLRPSTAPPPHNVMTAAQAGNGSRPLTLPSAATDQQPGPHIGRHRNRL